MANTVCITGASAGIGQATAKLFADNGWQVIAVARRKERLDELAEGSSAILPLELDITNAEAVNKAFAALPAKFAAPDVLLNNAGLARSVEPAQTCLLEDWEEIINTNIKGLLYVTRALLPGFIARDRGHVVNISSVAAECAYKGGNVYGASKAFVQQLSRNLRADVLGTSIKVTDIAPGMLESEYSLQRFRGDKAKADAVYAGTKPLEPIDIANCVWFAVNMPSHVNMNFMEVMPTCQCHGPSVVHREQV